MTWSEQFLSVQPVLLSYNFSTWECLLQYFCRKTSPFLNIKSRTQYVSWFMWILTNIVFSLKRRAFGVFGTNDDPFKIYLIYFKFKFVLFVSHKLFFLFISTNAFLVVFLSFCSMQLRHIKQYTKNVLYKYKRKFKKIFHFQSFFCHKRTSEVWRETRF